MPRIEIIASSPHSKFFFICEMQSSQAVAYASWDKGAKSQIEGAGVCDGLAVFQEGTVTFVAVATSQVTGRIWDGQVLLFSDSKCLSSATTETGNCDICWLGQRKLATSLDDGSICLWEVNDQHELGEPIAILSEHDDTASSVGVSPDNKELASGSWDTRVKIWDLSKQVAATTLEGHLEAVHTVAWSSSTPSTLLSGSQDKNVKLWDRRQETAAHFRAFTSPVLAIACHPTNEHLFAVGEEDGYLSLIDTRKITDKSPLHKFTDVHEDSVRRLSFCGQSASLLATASDDTTVKVVNIDTRAVVTTFEGHTDFVRGLAWMAGPTGHSLLSGGWDRKIWQHPPL